MKVIKPSATIYDPRDERINDRAVEKAEFCGRVCYNSLSNIEPGSAYDFVKRTAESGHGSVMEHGSVYLKFPSTDAGFMRVNLILSEVFSSPHTLNNLDRVYTNLRVIYEGLRDWQKPDKPFLFERHPEFFEAFVSGGGISQFGNISYFIPALDDPLRRITVDFIVDRGITHELVRHRAFSFSQESTRYCNYAGEKEGSEITVIDPFFWSKNDKERIIWCDTCKTTERNYMHLVGKGANDYKAKPQEGRSVLPNSLKARLLMTGNLYQWRELFKLRLSQGAHPQMLEVIVPLHQWFVENISAEYFDQSKFLNPSDLAALYKFQGTLRR